RRRAGASGRFSQLSSFALLLLSGRDRFDDAERVELRALRRERRLAGGRRVHDEEADLVFWDVDRLLEADVRSLSRQLLGGRVCPSLARRELTCCSARKECLDEVARHEFEARPAPER